MWIGELIEMGVYLSRGGREIRASCDRWHILAPIIFSLIEVGSYFIIITKDSIKWLECLRGGWAENG